MILKNLYGSLILIICIQPFQKGYSQLANPRQTVTNAKPSIDISKLNNWASVGEGQISNNGQFACYSVYNETPGTKKLVVLSTKSIWRKEYLRTSAEAFSDDSRFMVFRRGKDSVFILDLQTQQERILNSVKDFKLSNGSNGWIFYHNVTDTFSIRSLVHDKSLFFPNVLQYHNSPDGRFLLIAQRTQGGSELVVKLIDLANFQITIIWSTQNMKVRLGNFVFNDQGNIVAFNLLDENGSSENAHAFVYHDIKTEQTKLLTDSIVLQKVPGMHLGSWSPRFSSDGTIIFISLEDLERKTQKSKTTVAVDIWSSSDSVLQSLQLQENGNHTVYAAIVRTGDGTISRIEQRNEKIISESNEYCIVEKGLGLSGIFEAAWNKNAQLSYSLISLKDGSRKLLRDSVINPYEKPFLSSSGKWLIYYDFKSKDYFTYEIKTAKTYNISQTVNNNWEDEDNEYPESRLRRPPVWLADDAVLVYDTYDIWLLDPTGKNPPKNWTNGYGRKHKISFLIADPSAIARYSLINKERIFLSAFNHVNKESGYFGKLLTSYDDPELYDMGPYVYESFHDGNFIMPPIKSNNSNVYLGLRCSSTLAPNYFITHDFKRFDFISDVNPQKAYKWYTTTLYKWKSLDGRALQGILYKPEDFDSTQKYPVIFQYYEKRSDELNLFIRPAASTDEINIPSFVSKGYLVFVPDISYTMGKPGESAFNAVVSAAQFLSKFAWIDGAKMGLQGHSFGGYETGYIITHTNVFTAACAASGIYDLMSFYGSGARAGYPIYHLERSQGKMVKTPWQIKELYISNSPIYDADKVTTPLLMMQNKDDETVPFNQGLEFFTSLRRLGKKVWMLQYDSEGHSLDRFSQAAIDYHIRLLQFFDHYLKNAPAPAWMTKGVPAKLKGKVNEIQE